MTCDDCHALLPVFQLDALDDDVARPIEAHLAGCSSCLQRYFSARRVNASAAAFDERPSGEARDALRASVQRLGLRVPRRRVALWVGLAAAALVLLSLWVARSYFAEPALRALPSQPGLIDSARLSLEVT